MKVGDIIAELMKVHATEPDAARGSASPLGFSIWL
jgi:hypothetical protein